MTNDEAYLVIDSFKEHMVEQDIDDYSINKILNKGKDVIEKLEKISSQIDRKALIVGKVQSGKTINFLSVIANAFTLQYEFIFVFTSTETKLHNQTINRIKESFQIEKNNNFIEIFDLNSAEVKKMLKKVDEAGKRIMEFNKKGKAVIFTLLKNHSSLRIIKNIFQDEKLKKIKSLIIDDEGDLASLSRNKKEESKTLRSIKSFFNTLENSTYISVTATPQIQYLMKKDDEMIPRKVFCIEPGKGYTGLDIFDNDKYYEEVEKDDQNLLNEALLYYIICWTNILHEENLSDWKRQHSNFLIHTDVRTNEHVEIKNKIDRWIKVINGSLSDEDDFRDLIEFMKKIVDKYRLKNYLHDKEYLEKMKFNFEKIDTIIINQNNPNNINSSISTVVIGSRMLERGITFDNLIVTYFTNRSEKSKTAIDTLLQRARWFGYRKKILDYMKIFTTDLIKANFKEIKEVDDYMWNELKTAEDEDFWFNELDRDIFIKENSKLFPTSKTPLHISYSSNISKQHINYLRELKPEFHRLFNELSKSNELVKINKNNLFRSLSFNNIDDFFEEFSNLKSILFDSNDRNVKSIKNLSVKVCLLDNNGLPRTRGCTKLKEDYKIKQLFQGRSSNYKKGLEDTEYIGDANWNKLNNFNNSLIIQIHHIRPIDENDKDICDESIFAWALIFPEEISNQFIKYTPYED